MSKSITSSRWWMPLFSLFLGAIMFTAFAIGGAVGDGLYAFAVMAVLAAVFAFGASRSETLGGLGGPARDERWEMIDLRASALGAIAGVAYIIALVVIRRRF
jgi:hypothetical protein